MSFARLSLLATVLLGTACLDDSPVAPGADRAQVALAFDGVLPGATVEVRIFWSGTQRAGPSGSSEVNLATARVGVDSAELRIPLVVDLRPCLPLERRAAGDWCDVFIEVKLWEAGEIAVSTLQGPVRLAPGGTSVSPRTYLAVGNTPPILTLVDRAVRVESGLLRIRFAAADPDGDLIGADAYLVDTATITVGSSRATLPDPYGSFDGAVYLPIPSETDFALVKLRARDTRENASPELVQVLAPISAAAPVVSDVSGIVRSNDVELTFRVTDPEEDANVVDVVFRNVVDGEIVVADTIYGTCRRPIQFGNGGKTISCPRIPGVAKAEVVVVPFDAAGNLGRASRCAISSSSFSCSGQMAAAGGSRADAARWSDGEHREW